ncbi:MAG: Gfo/Idh/MocA family oxidoreductase [Leptolyngbya sp. SIO1E4]|nr:Gfo/Idh/MocA family oxidoreductase [Leptolyngbya sp. SIO1E4]
MKDDRIQLALFGVGRWGSHLLRNFLALPTVDVVAVVEATAEKLPQVQNWFELAADIDLTDDAEAILARPDVDAVAIATPAATHYDLIKTALKNGKHVLAEKPLTLEVATSEELCTLAAQQQRQLVIDHTYLFHPVVEKGQAVLAQQPLGHLRYGYATRTNLGPVRPDVDALWDLSIHDIAIFNYWLDERPIAVSAQGQVWLQSEASPASHFPNGLSDVVWLRLFYPSGFQATVHVSWGNPDKQRRLCVVGDRGTLIFDEMQSQAPLVMQRGHFEPQGLYFMPAGLAREEITVPPAEPLKQVCEHFLQCVAENRPSALSNGQVATDLVKILVALSESLNRGGEQVRITD